MLRAVRAPVRPRIVSPATKASLPLEDEVQLWLEQNRPGCLRIVGGAGSGKSTALAHLAAVFASQPNLCILDDGERHKVPYDTIRDPFMILSGPEATPSPVTRILSLAPWGRDELIEYLLAAHPKSCAAVLARVTTADEQEFAGVPELWRIALDELAGDASLSGPVAAVVRYVQRRVPSAEVYQQVEAACLETQLGSLPRHIVASHPGELEKDVIHLLRHAPVRRSLATECLVAQLQAGDPKCDLSCRLPRSLVMAVGARIADHREALAHLNGALRWSPEQSMAASLLHAADPGWTPPAKKPPLFLSGAYLDGVRWSGIRLPGVRLRNADLSHADLRLAELDDGDATEADLVLVRLSQASLNGFKAGNADLNGADLSSVHATRAFFAGADLAQATLDDAILADASFQLADLRRTSLRGAQLMRAAFYGAQVDETDFSGANLNQANLSELSLRTCCLAGASFRGTRFMKSDLEGMCLDGLDFSGARFEEALLTGSSMVGGNLTETCLTGAGLAEIDWPGACLRGADLRGATFHLGSSRSGLVDSTIASEGSRTGFYTDEYTEQDFKPPEEIRKANLCRADLRGAIVDGVDFYLVDLRGARYDIDQMRHFRRCGAILENHCTP
jgi:uncharacterized protein YjbI with pentapeptide repeats